MNFSEDNIDLGELEVGRFYRLTIVSEIADKLYEWQVIGSWSGRFVTADNQPYYSICVTPHWNSLQLRDSRDFVVDAVEVEPTYKEVNRARSS